MKETLKETLLNKFESALQSFPEASSIFEESFKCLVFKLEKDSLFSKNRKSRSSFLDKNTFVVKTAFNGWLNNYQPAIERGIRTNLDEISFAEFVSLFHPQRNVRLIFDKLRRKLDLNITAICNYGCPYCYQRSRDGNWSKEAKRAKGEELSIEDFKKIVLQAGLLGARSLKITGGEPLTKEGVFSLIEYALNQDRYKEIELLTNGSLLNEKKLNELRRIIRGKEKKFHLHTSIDGFWERNNGDNKFSKKHFVRIERLLDNFQGIKISVNSMWTRFLTETDSFEKIYHLLRKKKVMRWTISFPYLVNDLIKILKHDTSYVPDYEKVIELSKKLIGLHQEFGCPFELSIPLVFKHEMFDIKYSIPSVPIEGHPCFPCHGSYLIIDSRGKILDCLLVERIQGVNVKNENLLTAMARHLKDNEFYRIKYETVSQDCGGCRYEHLCLGQCVNDRARVDLAKFYFKNSKALYGRDKSACSLLSLAEKKIWPFLEKNYKEKLTEYLNPQGFYPPIYKNLRDVV